MLRTLFLAAGLLCLVGCSMNPGNVASAVPVQGRVVNANGKSVGNVRLMLSPAGRGLLTAALKVDDKGKFSGQVIPGDYMYHFEPLPGNQAAYSAIPIGYRETTGAHMVKLGEGDVELKLTK